jgi:glycosyltransferase involved in cell wall biosynthesis
MVKFSIIIPTYNRKDALRATLESLTQQTFKSFEVIVSDDGSTDGTKEMIKDFIGRIDIKYIWEPNWGGPARPRNLAAENASGEWLAFLDSDDLWFSNKLEQVEKHLGKNDVVYHALEAVSTSGKVRRILPAIELDKSDPFLDLLLRGNRLANSATCVRKSAFVNVQGFREEKNIIAVEDYDLWLRLAKAGFKFQACDQILGRYVLGDDNISAVSQRFMSSIQNVMNKHIESLGEPHRRIAIQNMYYSFGLIESKSKNYNQAMKFFMKCIAYRPNILSLKAAARLFSLAPSFLIGK